MGGLRSKTFSILVSREKNILPRVPMATIPKTTASGAKAAPTIDPAAKATSGAKVAPTTGPVAKATTNPAEFAPPARVVTVEQKVKISAYQRILAKFHAGRPPALSNCRCPKPPVVESEFDMDHLGLLNSYVKLLRKRSSALAEANKLRVEELVLRLRNGGEEESGHRYARMRLRYHEEKTTARLEQFESIVREVQNAFFDGVDCMAAAESVPESPPIPITDVAPIEPTLAPRPPKTWTPCRVVVKPAGKRRSDREVFDDFFFVLQYSETELKQMLRRYVVDRAFVQDILQHPTYVDCREQYISHFAPKDKNEYAIHYRRADMHALINFRMYIDVYVELNSNRINLGFSTIRNNVVALGAFLSAYITFVFSAKPGLHDKMIIDMLMDCTKDKTNPGEEQWATSMLRMIVQYARVVEDVSFPTDDHRRYSGGGLIIDGNIYVWLLEQINYVLVDGKVMFTYECGKINEAMNRFLSKREFRVNMDKVVGSHSATATLGLSYYTRHRLAMITCLPITNKLFITSLFRDHTGKSLLSAAQRKGKKKSREMYWAWSFAALTNAMLDDVTASLDQVMREKDPMCEAEHDYLTSYAGLNLLLLFTNVHSNSNKERLLLLCARAAIYARSVTACPSRLNPVDMDDQRQDWTNPELFLHADYLMHSTRMMSGAELLAAADPFAT